MAWEKLANVCNALAWEAHIGPWKSKPPAKEFTILIHKELEDLAYAIDHELDVRCFVMIDEKRRNLLEEDRLFGKDVSEAFQPAFMDIKEAGNCLALELNSAAVYHLMRVMEVGLRTLHKKLSEQPPKNPNWANLIGDIETEIQRREKLNPRPPDWKEEREFYIESARHFFFFKDKRNRSVHVELPFDEYIPPSSDQAAKIFEQVKSFMQHLATKLKTT